MFIPIYVVTGFLDAGKTTFLNNLLNREDWRDIRKLVIQFENGEEELQTSHENCYEIFFAKKAMEQQFEQIAEQIHSCMQSREFDEIWVEWNGVVPFSQLQSLALH
ncbi:MAG: permease, partial [Syntrophomonadaceae bacterium]|nr:permease [Syntrophomonadaceae bacterium]